MATAGVRALGQQGGAKAGAEGEEGGEAKGMNRLTIMQGDCREVLKTLPDESVQCCVTSPPYWGLRDYGTAKWEGGNADCDHVADSSKTKRFGNPAFNENRPSREATKTDGYYYDLKCGKCGAKRVDSQIGLESTPQAYVETMRQVFAEVLRVLREDGTLWLNLGDSYMGGGRGGGAENCKQRTNVGSLDAAPNQRVPGWKPKDLVGIPWRVAFALQADGWYLRSDIIWHKPNPMPESVTDRPTKAHEYLFMFSKNQKYFYDNEAISEPVAREWDASNGGNLSPNGAHKANGMMRERGREYPVCNGYRNKRTVWTVPTSPYPESHFATFPPDLIKPCILAGTKPGDTVLDPFAGSGTTGQVALELGRRVLLIELNPDYVKLCEQRCNVTPGLPL